MKVINILRLVVGSIEVIAGLVFLSNLASDIQLGFALVLIAMGVNSILNLK